MEARRLFQPVRDGKAKPRRVGALGINFRDGLMVKLTQRVKHAPGLLSLVRCRAEIVDAAAGEEVFELRKADHTCPLRQMGLYVPCGGFRIAGHDRDGGLGRVMAVFHAGGLGAFAVL